MTPGGSPTFTDDFHQVAQYYRNTLDWLVPRLRRWCRWWIDLILERYKFPLFEEFVPLPEPHPCPWDPRVRLGADVEASLDRTFGTGYVDHLVADALDTAELIDVAEHVRPTSTDDHARAERRPTLIDGVELRRGILGSVADALLRDLPASPRELREVLREDHDDAEVEKRVAVAVREAWAAFQEHYEEVARSTEQLVKGR